MAGLPMGVKRQCYSGIFGVLSDSLLLMLIGVVGTVVLRL
jgi:hypothetical protein